MIAIPKCYTRGCIHYTGIYSPDEESEVGQVPSCTAFPKGIPNQISAGSNEHLKPLKNQGNDIVFESIFE